MRSAARLPHSAGRLRLLMGLWLAVAGLSLGLGKHLAAANIAPDYPLMDRPIAEDIAAAPVIVEGTVTGAGSFQAVVDIDLVYKNAVGAGAVLPQTVRVTGFNSIAGDRAARALRPDERVILFLQPVGDLYFTPRSGGGKFVVEPATAHGEAKVVVSLGDPGLLVPLDPEHFRILLRAVIGWQPPAAGGQADPAGARLEAERAVAAGVTLAKSSLASGDPVRQYFGVVLARALAAAELADALTQLSETDNARIQAESLEALAALVGYFGWQDPRFDRAGLLRSARAGLRSKALRTRLAAALLLQELPADGAARDLLMFYRDAAAAYLALKSGDEKRRLFSDQRSRFWLSPALLKDPAAEAILLDFAASNDVDTATGALAVLGLRGSASSIPALVDLLGEKDFQYVDDAKIALFRIALSDEILKPTVDRRLWAAAAGRQTYAERLQAALARVDALLSTAGNGAGANPTLEARQSGILLLSCLPGEVAVPRLIAQTAIAPGDLAPAVFARTQSPLAFPYLGRALLIGDTAAQDQAVVNLRSWAELEPLARAGCDSEIGLAAAQPTRYGDNPGLAAAADLVAPDCAYGVLAGLALDSSTRYRGRRMQILQAYTGQSFGWGEYELDWNTRLWQWASVRQAQVQAGKSLSLPPAWQRRLRGEQARQAAAPGTAVAESIRQLGAADPLAARAAWRQLAVAGAMPDGDAARVAVLEPLWTAALAGENLQARCLAVNLLGYLRAPVDARIVRLVRAPTAAAIRHQAWWALGRCTPPVQPLADEAVTALFSAAAEAVAHPADSFEPVLATWALRTAALPRAEAPLAAVLAGAAQPAAIRQTAAAGLLYRSTHATAAEQPAILAVIARNLPDEDATVQQRLLAAIGANLGDPTPGLWAIRLQCLARVLGRASSENYDIPTMLLRFELDPQPYQGRTAYALDAESRKILRAELQRAWMASAEDPEFTFSTAGDVGYGWAYATGAWAGTDFNDLQQQAIDPLGRWPQRRSRTAAYAVEGLARAGAAVSVTRLRALVASDDDRLAGFAALILARRHQAEDVVPIFNRFNQAVPKSTTWFKAVAATGSPDGFTFLTDTMKTTGHEAWMATEALGQFPSVGARARLTQVATDPRHPNTTAAQFGWAEQLRREPDRMELLATGDTAQPLLLCAAVEWLPAERSEQAAAAVLPLLKSPEGRIRRRADMALAWLTGRPSLEPTATTVPAAAPLETYWRKQLGLPRAEK